MLTYDNPTPVLPIRSDYDGRQYLFPNIQGRLLFSNQDIVNACGALPFTEAEDGLHGLHLSPRMAQIASGSGGNHTIDWNNIPYGQDGRRTSMAILGDGGKPSFYIRRFCVHPITGEFFGDLDSDQHAKQIDLYGTRPFHEYVRFSNILHRRGNGNEVHVLLSRAYFNPEDRIYDYNPEEDREMTLRALALLRINGLPDTAQLFLSADRAIHQSFNIH